MMRLLFLHRSCFQLVLLLLLQSVPTLPVAAASATCSFPAVFVLGDSNSDTGGFSAAFGPLTRPYGETFGMPAGRFSDGRLIVDFIAESLGLPRISSYLDSLGANYSHGAGFASALSTILPQNVTLAQGGYSPFSLDVQLKQFSQFKSRSQYLHRQGGDNSKHLMPKEEYFSRGLYLFDIGQNDLTALYFLNRPRKQYLSHALMELSTVIRSVYENGGRSFWIHNTGPLGCLPYVLVSVVNNTGAAQLDSAGCSTVLNALARQFNRALNDTVKQLRRDLPLASLTLVDVYSVKYSLIKDAAKHGFQHPLRACCGHGGGEYNYDARARCGESTTAAGGKRVLVGRSCKDPGRSIIWDGAHYTEAANKWVFDRISGGAFSYPPNSSLSLACHREETKE